MTREEAIRLATGLRTDFKCESDTMVDFCNTVIEALEQESTYYPPCIDCHKKMDEIRLTYDKLKEQEPCEDVISRQAVLDIDFKRIILTTAKPAETIEQKVKSLPPVNPQPKTDVLDKIRAKIEAIIGEKGMDDYDFCSGLICVRNIIDKYKESEEEPCK